MLTVDSREPPEIMGLLKVPHERKQLDVGDFCWTAHEELVLVTRKGSDLVSSVYSDHFQDELSRMIQCLDSAGGGKAFAIMEGPWAYSSGKLRHYKPAGPNWFRAHTDCGGSPRFLVGTYISLFLSGIGVIYTHSLQETAEALTTLYERSMEGWPSSITRASRLPPLRRTTDTRVARLMSLCPRLSEKVALRLMKEFGSIGNVVSMVREGDHKRLLKVEGFGPGSLKKLQEVIQ